MKRVYILLAAFSLFWGCEKDNSIDTPKCIEDLIIVISEQPVTDPPESIYRYQYKGQTVYYRPARCCDIPSAVYDEDCNIICNPSGSIMGGDTLCPDFYESRTDEKLIWRDTRD